MDLFQKITAVESLGSAIADEGCRRRWLANFARIYDN